MSSSRTLTTSTSFAMLPSDRERRAGAITSACRTCDARTRGCLTPSRTTFRLFLWRRRSRVCGAWSRRA
jgi:hypothetical protein